MFDHGPAVQGEEGALAYLRSRAGINQHFFSIVSLINPHDVLFYPRNYINAGYTDRWLVGDINLPILSSANSLTVKSRNMTAWPSIMPARPSAGPKW